MVVDQHRRTAGTVFVHHVQVELRPKDLSRRRVDARGPEGAEVAIETTVKPTKIGGIPMFAARVAEASESRSPDFTNIKVPTIMQITRKPKYEISLNSNKTDPHFSNNFCIPKRSRH